MTPEDTERVEKILDAHRKGYAITFEHGRDIPLLCELILDARASGAQLRDTLSACTPSPAPFASMCAEHKRPWWECMISVLVQARLVGRAGSGR
jgi:hypothetical protein